MTKFMNFLFMAEKKVASARCKFGIVRKTFKFIGLNTTVFPRVYI